MEMEVKVGPQSLRGGDGTLLSLRGGPTGAAIVQELHGRYWETTRIGRTFNAANQAVQAISVALATTYTGFLLYNPNNSGKVLVPNKVKFALSVAPAAIAVLGLLSGYSTTAPSGTTALTVKSNQIGNAASGAGVAYSAATISTPTVLMPLWDGFTAAALPAPTMVADLEGLFGILPGGFIGFYALTAVSGFGAMSWEEIDLPI
jgi:hypothetical protein